MSRWDSKVETHLAAYVDRLKDTGVVGLLEEQVAKVYRRNADAFDHQEGDTPLSLGITCSENFHTLVLRDSIGQGSAWTRAGVLALTVNGSLQLNVGETRIACMKAPPVTQRVPHWQSTAFNWAVGDSGVRASAAARNRHAYWPQASDQDNADLTFDCMDHPGGDVAQLRDYLMVWTGDITTGLTAGWLGVPTMGPNHWYAVAPLWWHDAAPSAGAQDSKDGGSPTSETYDAREVPLPEVRLKARPERADGAA